MQSEGQNQKDFFTAQQYLSPINTQSLFQWDKTKNGGFSSGDVTIRQVSKTYKEINVANQYYNHDSPLYYLKKFIEFIKNPIYRHFFNSTKTNMTVHLISKSVIKYILQFGDEKLFIFINISINWKRIKISDKLGVVLSNYSKKTYNNKIKMLAPYEAVILFSKKEYNQ
jgi:glycosidase